MGVEAGDVAATLSASAKVGTGPPSPRTLEALAVDDRGSLIEISGRT